MSKWVSKKISLRQFSSGIQFQTRWNDFLEAVALLKTTVDQVRTWDGSLDRQRGGGALHHLADQPLHHLLVHHFSTSRDWWCSPARCLHQGADYHYLHVLFLGLLPLSDIQVVVFSVLPIVVVIVPGQCLSCTFQHRRKSSFNNVDPWLGKPLFEKWSV